MITREMLASAEGNSPQRAVRSPHRRLLAGVALALVAAGGVLVGCEAQDSAQTTKPYVAAIGTNEKPIFANAELTLYESQVAVPFPIRKPTGAESSALKSGVKPYPHAPFLLDSDETIEVNYTVTNLDNQAHNLWIVVDPWNEFVWYKPGVTVVSQDETEPNLSGIEAPLILNAMERIQGNFEAQDMSQLALKLDTAMQIEQTKFGAMADYGAATLMNHDFNTQNVPGPNDILLASYTPTVVAGLTGLNFGLESYEPLNVSIEVTVTVLDTGSGKVEPPGTTTGLIGMPTTVLTVPGSM